jgi:serine/threonine protein phosphatase PrpC
MLNHMAMKFDFAAEAPKKVPRPTPRVKPDESGVIQLTPEDILPNADEVELSPEDVEDDTEDEVDVDLTGLESRERPVVVGAASEASMEHPDRNEDSYYATLDSSMVADGMGSVPGGEVASMIACDTMRCLKEGKAGDSTNKFISDAMEAYGQQTGAESLERMKTFFSSENKQSSKEDAESSVAAMFQVMDSAITKWKNSDPEIMKKVEEKSKAKGATGEDLQKEVKRNFDTLGTTASMMQLWTDAEGKKQVTFGSIGDSRIYRLRGGELKRMTRDDSFIQALSDAGIIGLDEDTGHMVKLDDIRRALKDHPEWQSQQKMKRNYLYLNILASLKMDELPIGKIRNQMLQNLGGADRIKKEFGLDLEPNISTEEAEEGDVYINATDGLLDNKTDAEILEGMQSSSDPEAAAKSLALKAKLKSGSDEPGAKKDDITVVVTAT